MPLVAIEFPAQKADPGEPYKASDDQYRDGLAKRENALATGDDVEAVFRGDRRFVVADVDKHDGTSHGSTCTNPDEADSHPARSAKCDFGGGIGRWGGFVALRGRRGREKQAGRENSYGAHAVGLEAPRCGEAGEGHSWGV